jgi:hypothetical protein
MDRLFMANVATDRDIDSKEIAYQCSAIEKRSDPSFFLVPKVQSPRQETENKHARSGSNGHGRLYKIIVPDGVIQNGPDKDNCRDRDAGSI